MSAVSRYFAPSVQTAIGVCLDFDDLEVVYEGTPASKGYRSLADGQMEPDYPAELAILSVFILKYDAKARKHFKLDISEWLSDYQLADIEKQIKGAS